MQYSIENDILRLTVDSHGAEPVSVIHKPTGAELLWQADPAVCKRHAPILFPYTGKLTGGKMLAKGVEYAGGQHGFARDVEHTMTHHADNLLEFELHANAETLPKWPYAFVLRSTFTLEGETVHHTLTVENRVIFMRRYWFSDSYKDIAEVVGLSEKNVSVRLTRIREKMKQYLIEREVFI